MALLCEFQKMIASICLGMLLNWLHRNDVTFWMQSEYKKTAPQGFVSAEWQAMMTWVMLPELQAVADKHFNASSGWWSDQAARSYDWLIAATGHDPSKGAKFLLSHDQDGRHSYMTASLDGNRKRTREREDRRTLDHDDPRSIPLHPVKSYLPFAPKTQDCIQSPVEMCFSQVKRLWKEGLAALREETQAIGYGPRELCKLARQVIHEAIQVDLTRACWGHAENAIKVFSMPQTEVSCIKGVVYHGRGGHALPSACRG